MWPGRPAQDLSPAFKLIDWMTLSAPLDRVDLAKVIDQGSEERSAYFRL
jgi:hypothetical protein